MKPTWTRTLCISAFVLLLLQGGLLNCAACCCPTLDAVAAPACDGCHDHEGANHPPGHRCTMHPAPELVQPSRTEAHVFSPELVSAETFEIVTLQTTLAIAAPYFCTAPPDPGWRDLHTIIIRC